MQAIHLPGLNGLRAIASLAVVIAHVSASSARFGFQSVRIGRFQIGPPVGFDLGVFAVTLFFTLSGFLITYLLQNEKALGRISVKRFYIRRLLRIWPLYYLYGGTAMLTACAVGMDWNYRDVGFYVFFAANIPLLFESSLPLLGHYWSIGAEEQFYLIWPWINKKITNMGVFIAVIITTIVGVKLTFHIFSPQSTVEKLIEITRFHCMMIGALGAIWYKRQNKIFVTVAGSRISQGIGWLCMASIFFGRFHIASVIDHEIVSVLTLVLIIGQIGVRNRLVNLDLVSLDFLGRISYGIYIIHPIFVFLSPSLLRKLEISSITRYLLAYFTVIAATTVFAWLSYRYFESYFLRIKDRFAVIHTSVLKPASTKRSIGGR